MNDQVAIITGAASGVGRRFATELWRRRPEMRLVLADGRWRSTCRSAAGSWRSSVAQPPGRC